MSVVRKRENLNVALNPLNSGERGREEGFSRACKSRRFAIVARFIESCAKISNSSRPGGRLSSGVNCHTYKIAH